MFLLLPPIPFSKTLFLSALISSDFSFHFRRLPLLSSFRAHSELWHIAEVLEAVREGHCLPQLRSLALRLHRRGWSTEIWGGLGEQSPITDPQWVPSCTELKPHDRAYKQPFWRDSPQPWPTCHGLIPLHSDFAFRPSLLSACRHNTFSLPGITFHQNENLPICHVRHKQSKTY